VLSLVAVGLLGIFSFASDAWAQDEGILTQEEEQTTAAEETPSFFDSFISRVAELLSLPADTVKSAFLQARQELGHWGGMMGSLTAAGDCPRHEEEHGYTAADCPVYGDGEGYHPEDCPMPHGEQGYMSQECPGHEEGTATHSPEGHMRGMMRGHGMMGGMMSGAGHRH
jgi:hypothetical protein